MSQRQAEPKKEVDWSRVMNAAGPYPLEAFSFVREGLSFTAERVHAVPREGSEMDRHISGQQLCMGLRDYAIDRYGLMAPVVLGHWHIKRTDDFGRIVFAMIKEGLMSKTEDDTLDDFRAVYDFGDAFSRDQLLASIATG